MTLHGALGKSEGQRQARNLVSTEFGDERALAAAVGGHNPVTTFTRMERPGTVNIYMQTFVPTRRRSAERAT